MRYFIVVIVLCFIMKSDALEVLKTPFIRSIKYEQKQASTTSYEKEKVKKEVDFLKLNSSEQIDYLYR